ncbi:MULTISPECIES: YggS family pyridoxal phosphate-dependent enzyme [Caproicibacterium]|uniref:Pyridoxal phosphate homeostasis protein n=1 Tax=Caproicibacterium lactatifermentans TaxID=2666138 RepID=A0A859DTA2_9FIRM|nr:YggS family pyridoxal phosphate-dependent enzyme [Caproicibacterium lactatifermentans]ARP50175.1 YggS family pyridoxal phosphate enzyme [Ruminococcaceae bacterium CPB6]MDD4807949.1 YggS family pyridoxal phosphate-dependent enzyme [Oscillospiraceae bacterium]QKN24102.1 YggS family pyridoxal phosphate-dependent enzyme [Caproicibacterium lactatifermentans]QKO30830.1 YggS family pyridoxal phosphate-dependent enzyme [Caproicibacterium lactatifermentans]
MTTKSLSEEDLQRRFRDVEENLKVVEERIAAAAEHAGRKREDITLLAATKTVPVEIINHGIEAGIRCIGENRVQELMDKYEGYRKDLADVQFIGHLQTNKVKYLIGKVSLIQSIDSRKLAAEVSRLSQRAGITTNILLEVNIGREENKSGVLPENLEQLLGEVSQMPNIQVRGLMAIPPAGAEKEETFAYFTQMYQYFIDIGSKKLDNVSMQRLSMGMSADYELAIAAGANMVRVGSALFGPRDYSKK